MSIFTADLHTPRLLAARSVRPIGLGCMNLNHGYSHFLDHQDAVNLVSRAITEAGVDHLDTATLYGGGRNENIVGEALAATGARDQIFLASKGGLTATGERRIDGRPETLRAQVDASLQRLGTDHIDLYYLHRLDPTVPVEVSAGALAEMIQAGKIGAYGLSEVSADTVLRAHQVHPVAAVQNEYSLWTRNPEWGLLEACRETGATLVAFSPVGRGFLTSTPPDVAQLPDTDMRPHMPRFTAEHYPANLALHQQLTVEADRLGCTVAQLALAWVLAQGEHVIAIPGTTSYDHLVEDLGAEKLVLTQDDVATIDSIMNHSTVHGHRYNQKQQATIDTEDSPGTN